ncbi:hypothetical protein GZL_09388 [Streptomyces sp. 769]|nr:hypothetical protein GZL_00025 [Streptomyces sp. 769]AJC61906.1 hypothetical protein GZL_09388 [Streptomyces sp. 769]
MASAGEAKAAWLTSTWTRPGHAGGRLGYEGWRFHSRSARSQKAAESREL